jgi:2-hydroxy-6-oxonona-2,4-dienedioate hydrolase
MLNHTRHGKGRTLVLVHGFLGGTGYWTPLATGLKHAMDVIAVDLPGFAGSAKIPAPESLSGYARSVLDTVDALGVKQFSMLGFSMGGMIVQQAALDFPDRLEKLVLYGSSAIGDLPHRFESWEASIARIDREGVEATADRTVATWFVEREKHPYYPVCREACRGAYAPSCKTVMRAMQHWDNRPHLKDIGHSTLVIVGDKDRSTKVSDSIVLWEGLPNAQLAVLPNCAHGAHMEKPDAFNRFLLDFLAES